ncbi:MAG: hypothetical protein L0216_13280, partial [Planctomycetales bacterium]|nr:hypothetical protein [Planctomycetales bacterium]
AQAGKLGPQEAAALRGEFEALPAGSPSRPALAVTVARALGDGAGLAGFLDSLPREEEPRIRSSVIRALDAAPTEPYRAFLLRVAGEEKDADVLQEAWDKDRVATLSTPEAAARLVAAIEPRVGRGDLSPEVRGLGYRAVALAGQLATAESSAALARAAAAERSPALAALASSLQKLVAAGNATTAGVGDAWKRARLALRTEPVADAPAGR